MALVNRLLDAFFRTLDAVDTARERLDRVLGKNHDAAASQWDADPTTRPTESFTQRPAPEAWPTDKATPARATKSTIDDEDSAPAKAPARSTRTPTKPSPPKASARADKAVGGTPRKKKGGSKAPQKASRKGSVDRTGADFDSPRARAVFEQLKAARRPVVSEDAALSNKKVLARVVWALNAAHEAGSSQGLTAADASALLHMAAEMDVFSTNIARACRDESELIEESEPDGRIKRFRLTAAGRAAAATLATRAG